jgi:protein quaking
MPRSSYDQLLKEMNRSMDTLPRELFALDLETARRYLQATASGLPRFLTDRFPAWRAKMLADPNFFFKLLMEETVGMGLCLTGVIVARGDRLMQELDFVLIDTLVGASLSFVLIWLLAPSARMGAAMGQPGVKTTLQPLAAMRGYLQELPSCAFAPATRLQQYDWMQRATAFVYKGLLFAAAGFAASMIGTSLGYALLALRKRYTGQEPENRMPPILIMSLGWAGFMFVSANPRYQVLTAAELWIYEKASPVMARASTAILRTLNSIAGGATWVHWARALGLNQSGDVKAS